MCSICAEEVQERDKGNEYFTYGIFANNSDKTLYENLDLHVGTCLSMPRCDWKATIDISLEGGNHNDICKLRICCYMLGLFFDIWGNRSLGIQT